MMWSANTYMYSFFSISSQEIVLDCNYQIFVTTCTGCMYLKSTINYLITRLIGHKSTHTHRFLGHFLGILVGNMSDTHFL